MAVEWQWVADNLGLISRLTAQHLYLALTPVVYGLLISLPVGMLCVRWARVYPPVLAATSTLYALPSLALFVFFIAYTGLTAMTAIIPLTIYTLSVLVRNVVEGLRSVPEPVRESAAAMGYRPAGRLLRIELPIAVPVIIAGVRIATVSSISLVSVAALIGLGGLGTLFTDGFQRQFYTPVIVGIVLTIVLALVSDAILVAVQRVLTPWAQVRRAT